MKFEVLKRSHLKRNIIIGVIAVAIISTIILNFTRAKYRVTQSIPLVKGTINYTPYDLKMVAMYQENDNGEYESVDAVPDSGYVLNEIESYCEIDGVKDSSITIIYENGVVNIGVKKKGTKCYLYFDEKEIKNIQDLIASYSNILTKSDFLSSETDKTRGTIYKSLDSSQYDNDGEVYYFSGNPTDNWVYFAEYYWRIIKINGNGSVRIIYNGPSENQTGSETQIGVSVFNAIGNNNMYVGYMYSSGQVHGLGTDSTIKNVLDDWYQNNLLDKYHNYIDGNAGFCGDRSLSSGSGLATDYSDFGAYERFLTKTDGWNKNPKASYKCMEEDLYTVHGSDQGNKALTYPIGLITLDEAVYAYGAMSSNSSSFLYTGNHYWTMTPLWAGGNYSYLAYLVGGNVPQTWFSASESGIRPVINLKADVTISSGDGTASNPYVIAT